MRIDRRRKLPATVLLRALGYSEEELLHQIEDSQTDGPLSDRPAGRFEVTETKRSSEDGSDAGGGLTIIANAPNPAGVSILKKYFNNEVSPGGILAGALIPTIRSRCRFIPMQPLDDASVRALLEKEYFSQPEEDLELIARIAEGSIGRAVTLMEEGGVDTIRDLVAALQGWEEWNWPQIHRMSESLGRAGQEDAYHAFTRI